MTEPRHFLDLDRIDATTLRRILDDAARGKRARSAVGRTAPDPGAPLSGRLLAMVFEKPSTRTRVSFHVAMRQLGGDTLELAGRDLQLERGETAGDTARSLSRYADAIMARTSRPETLQEIADAASVPVINGLTARSHPCQVMADLLTVEERRGDIGGTVVAWCGAGNNMAHSWIHAAARFGCALRLACPPELEPRADVLAWAQREGARVALTDSPEEAVRGAGCVVTDTWVSMSDDESDAVRRCGLLRPYRVDARLMASAVPDALFLHCLPAHRGEEVTAEVIDGPQSVVWDEAENRVHAQKAILSWCLSPGD